jgi:fatty acid desaturase
MLALPLVARIFVFAVAFVLALTLALVVAILALVTGDVVVAAPVLALVVVAVLVLVVVVSLGPQPAHRAAIASRTNRAKGRRIESPPVPFTGQIVNEPLGFQLHHGVEKRCAAVQG